MWRHHNRHMWLRNSRPCAYYMFKFWVSLVECNDLHNVGGHKKMHHYFHTRQEIHTRSIDYKEYYAHTQHLTMNGCKHGIVDQNNALDHTITIYLSIHKGLNFHHIYYDKLPNDAPLQKFIVIGHQGPTISFKLHPCPPMPSHRWHVPTDSHPCYSNCAYVFENYVICRTRLHQVLVGSDK